MNIVIWLQNTIQMGGGTLNPAINVLNRLYGNINVLGAILPQGININGVKTINDQDLKSLDYDLILVLDYKIAAVLKKAKTLEIDTDKIVSTRVVCTPLFTLEKYNKLRNSQLSIISMNCWGSLTYNAFGLEFLSPTINMRTITDEEFLKMLQNPITNMNKELKFDRVIHDDTSNVDHPVFKLGEVDWWMIHDDADHLESIVSNWYKRRYRINWLNTLAVMNTKNIEVLNEFAKLPFSKKVCFVPFKTDIDCGFYINPDLYKTDEFNNSVACLARDSMYYYDMWDALLYGKKTPLIVQK